MLIQLSTYYESTIIVFNVRKYIFSCLHYSSLMRFQSHIKGALLPQAWHRRFQTLHFFKFRFSFATDQGHLAQTTSTLVKRRSGSATATKRTFHAFTQLPSSIRGIILKLSTRDLSNTSQTAAQRTCW